MIACAGSSRIVRGERTPWDVGAEPNMRLAS
jgi:hypothetical protein